MPSALNVNEWPSLSDEIIPPERLPSCLIFIKKSAVGYSQTHEAGGWQVRDLSCVERIAPRLSACCILSSLVTRSLVAVSSDDCCRHSKTRAMHPCGENTRSVSVPIGDGGNPSPSGESQGSEVGAVDEPEL